MADSTLRVGIVGAGGIVTSRHIPGLRDIEGVEIAGVCNRSRESSERVAREFDIPKVYDHWWELVEAPDTDAIVIGTWPYMHCSITLAALAADKHVMCQARMAMNAREAHTMLNAAGVQPHLVTQVVPAPFTLRVDSTVKRHIADGYFGDLLAIEVRINGGNFIDSNAPMHWRNDFEMSGFNVMGLGIWYESVMRWVGEARRVMAMGRTFVKMRRDPQNGTMRAVHIPQHLDVIADMACGAQAHFLFSSVAGLLQERDVFLFGTEGTLRFSGDRLYGGRRGDDELQEIVIPPEEEGKWRVEKDFVNAIRGNGVIALTTFEDGAKYMEFTEAVARSTMEGREIALPLRV